nr:hypothetical protein [Pelagibacterium limicola]
MAVCVLYLINLPFADNPASLVLTLPAFALVIVGLVRLRSPNVQVGDVFWFCVFIFFVLGPIQGMTGWTIGARDGWAQIVYTADEYILASTIVFLFLLPFVFIRLEYPPVPLSGKAPGLGTLAMANAAGFVCFVISQGGIAGVLSPRLEQAGADGFIASTLFLGLQTVTTALIALRMHRKVTPLAVAIFTLAIVALVVTRNPFNASRFSLLAAWLPVVLAVTGGRLPAPLFNLGSLFGLVVLFPILSLTTRLGVDGLNAIAHINFLEYVLHIPFVDVYDTLVHAVRYMQANDHTVLEKLGAIVLFFIPRSIWPEKPIVGGLDIGKEIHAIGMEGTANLSFFIGGDFYMDLGLVGVCIGGPLCAALLAWTLKRKFGFFYGLPVLHFLFIASTPILLRGPVGAVLPLFSMQILSLLILSVSSPPWVKPTPSSQLPIRR